MVSISIYGLGKPKGTWPDSPFTVLGGVDKSGRGVLAEMRHCEIKINWQEMFAIQIPIPAGRAEGTGRAEPVGSQRSSAAGRCLLPLEGLPESISDLF